MIGYVGRMFVGLLCAVVLCPVLTYAAADRDRLLTEAGVYGTFAAFSFDEQWGRDDVQERISHLKVLKGVVEQHREKVAIDVYLLRGLSDHADLLFRIHARELRDAQAFLLDLQGSVFGTHLQPAGLLQGASRKANYVPAFSDALKADLAGASNPGETPYVIVLPIKKTAEWWGLDQATRTKLMQEHTGAALPYQQTVKRKLYHSTGLDDQDFITYFETSKLEDFQNLMLALQRVPEFQFVRRLGHQTWVGRAMTIEALTEALAQ